MCYRQICAIDQAALSMDPLLVQPLIDCAVPSAGGFRAGGSDWHGPNFMVYSCFVTVHVDWGTGKSELHVWLR